MLLGAKHLLAASLACLAVAGCSGGNQSALLGGWSLGPASRVRPNGVRELASDRAVACRPLQSSLRGAGGTFAFRSNGSLTVLLGYAANSLGPTGAERGYIEGCAQPLGGNTPQVPEGETLDWEGIVSTDGNFGIAFAAGKRAMTFSGSALNARTKYQLLLFEASPQLTWSEAGALALGAPVQGVLSTPSLLQNGYRLAGSAVFFILVH